MFQLKNVQKTDKVIRAIDGHEIRMSGTVNLILIINRCTLYFQFMVLNNCTVDCLLGTDVIKCCYEIGKVDDSWTVDILNGVYDDIESVSLYPTYSLESIIQIPNEVKFYYQQLLRQTQFYYPLFYNDAETSILNKNKRSLVMTADNIAFKNLKKNKKCNMEFTELPMMLVFIILLLSFIAKTYRVESRVTIMIPDDTYVPI